MSLIGYEGQIELEDDDWIEICEECRRDIWACICDDDDCPFCGEDEVVCTCNDGAMTSLRNY